ncbi:MAG: class I SAM-dependent methyltransferase [Deltaproteobacteria bacterium]|nr:class I SAM-dependent methyltransferase [Deltaproteobacteria bacterium]
MSTSKADIVPFPAPGEKYLDFTSADARDYDRQVYALLPGYRRMLRTIVDFLKFNDIHGEITDLGAGTGNLARLILDEISDVSVRLVDFSTAMCERAKEKLEGYENRSEFHCEDIEEISFPSNQSVVVSTFTLHELHPGQRCDTLVNGTASLRRGGYFFVGDYYYPKTAEERRLFSESTRHHAIATGGVCHAEIDDELSAHINNSTLPESPWVGCERDMPPNTTLLFADAGVKLWFSQITPE